MTRSLGLRGKSGKSSFTVLLGDFFFRMETKVLSPDNFIKMIWIALRVESKVPATWLEVSKNSSWRAGSILVRASSKCRCLVTRWKQTWLVDVFLLETMNFDFHVS